MAGFGDYVVNNIEKYEEKGMYIIKRRGRNYHDAAEDLANMMFGFVQKSKRDRINLRYKCEESSLHFDGSNLGKYYDEAYKLAVKR